MKQILTLIVLGPTSDSTDAHAPDACLPCTNNTSCPHTHTIQYNPNFFYPPRRQLMSTPQLILTLSPLGTLQAELPGPNGARRRLQLSGAPEDILTSLVRVLLAQQRGETLLGQEGAPTQHQFTHTTRHSSAVEGCPFCNLGLQHSDKFCNNSTATKTKQIKTKKRQLSASTRAICEAWAPTIDPAELGI